MGSDYRRLHSPGQPLAGGCTPDWESKMVAIAVSFVIGASGSVGVTCQLVSVRVGTGVQPRQGENYMYNRILGHVHLLSWFHFLE